MRGGLILVGKYVSGLLYLFSFTLTVVNATICEKRIKKNILHKPVWYKLVMEYLFIFYPVIVVYGFRYLVGVDYINYLDYFRYLLNGGKADFFHTNFEAGYVLVNIIASKLFIEGYGITLVNGVIIFVLLYMNVSLDTCKRKMSIGIYIFLMVYFGFSCNGVRQMIAALVVLYGYQFVIKHQFKQYLVCIVVASLFHKSALFIIVFYLIGRCKTDIECMIFKIMACLSGVAVIIFRKQILMLVSLTSYASHRDKNAAGFGNGMTFLLYVIPTLFLVEFFKQSFVHKKKEYNFLILLLYLQIPFQCIGVYNPVLERMAIYCSIAQVILIPMIVINIHKNRYIASFLFKIWYLFYFWIMEICKSGNGINNYQIWHS